MKMMKTKLIIAGCLAWCMNMAAQTDGSSSSQFLSTLTSSDVYVPFRISDEGKQFPIRWGLDVAWMSEGNIRIGINHVGKKNLSLIRSSFRTDAPLTDAGNLTNSQIATLRERMRLINILSPDCDIILNSDQEAGVDEWYGTSGNSNVEHWVEMIAANIEYIKKYYPRHAVIGISPFNEPDFTQWKQGSKNDMKEISRLLKERYPDLLITAGNTLNCDQALPWYNAVKPYVDWGNTHQLAGSFDNYANFFKQVREDGNHAYADELHNVGEAMVGAEYGMQTGVWWGFDSRARGEFCQISNQGSRIGYAENRAKWTSASVYRNDETKAVKAFLGSSERQANTSTFTFISTDREVYFDGYGPTRAFKMQVPGGTGYEKGQTNAERVIDITYGEDVPPTPITKGVYKIMNLASKGVVAVNGTSDGFVNISQMKWTDANQQKWNIEPIDERIGGDYSFFKITSVSNGKYMNVLNNATSTANVISFDAGCAPNEQWYLEYAGNGSYYIRNRLSGLYLELVQKTIANGTNIRQAALRNNANERALQQWRILPTDVACETEAPAVPVNLSATSQSASVRLQWTSNSEEDLAGYMILRTEKGSEDWNTIARKVTGNYYVDNTCRQGVAYEYKVKAIDVSENQSACTEPVDAMPTGAKGLVAQWQFDDELSDGTENAFDVIHVTDPSYATEHISGSKALTLNGTKDYVQLPYEIADMDEMTISMWVYWTNVTSNWTRLFDFGNGTGHYMYLTPQSGSGMRFAIKNGGTEQQLTFRNRLGNREWKHVALTIGNGRVVLYVDGKEVAESSSITIRPSDIRPTMNYLGRSQFPTDPLFRGYMDDVRIYNYALSASEVNSVMGDVTDGILQLSATDSQEEEAVYDLSGRRVSSSGHVSHSRPRNIYIIKGKKLLPGKHE